MMNNANTGEMIEVHQQGMLKGKPPDPCIVVIFGASGDLTHKELIPSLFALSCHKLMPEQCAVIGFSRSEFPDDKFRNEMFDAVKKDSICGEDKWNEFAQNLFYIDGNFNTVGTSFRPRTSTTCFATRSTTPPSTS